MQPIVPVFVGFDEFVAEKSQPVSSQFETSTYGSRVVMSFMARALKTSRPEVEIAAMKELVTRQVFKILSAALMYPLCQYLIMPMVCGSVQNPMQELEAGDSSDVAGEIPGVKSPRDVARLREQAQSQFAEINRQLNGGKPSASKSGSSTARSGASGISWWPFGKKSSEPETVKEVVTPTKVAPTVTDVGGHTITIAPTANASNSVIIQSGPQSKNSKNSANCRTGST